MGWGSDWRGGMTCLSIWSCFHQFYEAAHTIQLAAVQWGNARTFLKNLVLIAKSNVNTSNKPKWIKFQPETDENEKTAYGNPSQGIRIVVESFVLSWVFDEGGRRQKKTRADSR